MVKLLTEKQIEDFFISKDLGKQFCITPFTTLLFEANGDVCLCRQKGTDFVIGNLKEQSWQEIWNGEKIKKIREEFLKGQVQTCSQEICYDFCHLSVDNNTLLPLADFSLEQKDPPLKITPNFNGKCNLQCPMCHVWQFSNGLYDQIGFWDILEKEILPFVKEIDLFSGEPFIQKDTYRLIKLVSKMKKDCCFSFTTNGNWILNQTIKDHLDLVPIKNFIFSIDSFNPETYSLIRPRGNLKTLFKNFELVQAYEKERLAYRKSGLGMTINFTLQKANWKELPLMISFKEEKNVQLAIRTLIKPERFSLQTMNENEKIEIFDYYLKELKREQFIYLPRALKPLFDSMTKFNKAECLLRLKEKFL